MTSLEHAHKGPSKCCGRIPEPDTRRLAKLQYALRQRNVRTYFARDILMCVTYTYLMYDLWADMVRRAPYKPPFCADLGTLDPWNRLFRPSS
jgi:hypothetical protein